MSHVSREDVYTLLNAVAWIAEHEVAFFAKRFPNAVKWHTIWAEVRQSYCAHATEETKHRSAVVLCWRNEKNQQTRERLLFAGSGDCPICTTSDLLVQMRAELPAAFKHEPKKPEPQNAGHVVFVGRGYPVGILGTHVIGQA